MMLPWGELIFLARSPLKILTQTLKQRTTNTAAKILKKKRTLNLLTLYVREHRIQKCLSLLRLQV